MAKRTGLGRGLGSLISGGVAAKKAAPEKAKAKKTVKKKAAKPQRKQKKAPSKKKKAPTQVKPEKAPVLEGTKRMPSRKPVEPVSENLIGLHELPITRIIPNPHQPRREFHEESLLELAESIRSEGLLQPVVVRLQGEKYELIAGERRWRACQKLKMKLVPARVIEASESSSAILSLIENLQREDLNPIEEAMGYASLMKDFDLTQEQVAERVGRNRASVANSLRLLQLAREIQGYIIKGHLSVGHAKVLLGVEDSENRLLLARQSIERGWSVRELERRVESFRKPGDRPQKSRSVTTAELSAIEDLQKQLSGAFSTRVTLKHTPKKGKIIIEYYGNDDLQRIMEEMGLH
ncbi:ParB/RepB/Spo0J family partition protein [Puniceicoccales bacterium CK1056]|uniref:ParB/RepB/Spo0J family partition protein n=1 Tax=Oceanipulchritudo coccoides TaxID=2706888 RepID=A0A6B2M1C8_9BACT|nr:ParB/RepB/Spo0J family partition protein [Oceanipulchritudo coccoides]NDV62523.1 ParB/RepB/Spo0J family partition protein [Oceanipulchritudo coccoides]